MDHIGAVASQFQLAQLLRHLRRREARGRGGPELTYRELAARTGWSIGLLAGYFGGRILPPTDRFDELVALLAVTPAERGALATARDRAQENRRRPRPAGDRPVPRQLPPASYRFVGRAGQLDELDGLVVAGERAATGTIVVVSGTAGVGKTSLAVHWAHRVAHRFPDGQLFVNLRGFDPDRPPANPGEAVRDFLDALGVAATARPVSDTAQANLYRSVLAGLRVLIVLDNARHADQVRPLLPAAPGCLTVVTSRHQLTGLVAVEGAHRLVVDLMPVADARELLAHRIGPRVAAEPEVVDEVIDACARLPLALAVVAARASARPDFPLAAVADELRRARGSLNPFAGEDAAADARAAFACSYARLSPVAAELFRRLGAHPGPDVTAPAAASLIATTPGRAQPPLAELAHAHLVTEHVPGRYAMHDLLRTFAVEQAGRLDTDAGRRAAVERTLNHYLHTGYAAVAALFPTRGRIAAPPPAADVTAEPIRDRDEARRWLGGERRVLVGAVTQAATEGFPTHAWQLAWTVTDFLDSRGHWPELLAVQRVALAAAEAAADRTGQLQALRGLARANLRLGRDEEARGDLERAIALCREPGGREPGGREPGEAVAEASCHLGVALIFERRRRHRYALDSARRALALFRAAGHGPGYASSLGVVGWYHALLGEYELALECCRSALAMQRRLGGEMASTLDSLGCALHHLGRHDEAAAAYEGAVAGYRETGDRYHEADTLIHLGDTRDAAGAADDALAAWRRALAILDDLGHRAADEVRSRFRSRGRVATVPQ
jgi:tetratricopeptide (TPR) repeat protein